MTDKTVTTLADRVLASRRQRIADMGMRVCLGLMIFLLAFGIIGRIFIYGSI